MTFLHKNVGDEQALFGSDLRDLRELHAISFDQACRETRIDAGILKAFEEDRISDVRDPMFAERHLMAYVRYLGGYEPYFKAKYQAALTALAAHREASDVIPRTRIRFFDLFVAPQFLAFLGIGFLALLLGGYVFWQAFLVHTAPMLNVISPEDNDRLLRPRVLVRGETISGASVSVNGRDAAVDQNGAFQLELDVRRGTTILTITAKRRRGSETTVIRRVSFEQALTDTDAGNAFASSSQALAATSTSATSTDGNTSSTVKP